MENLYLAFSVVAPVTLLVLLGYILKYVKLYDESFLKTANSVCFKVFLPALIFINVYTSDFSKTFQPALIIYGTIAVIITFLFLLFFMPKIESNNEKLGVMVQGAFRSNFVLFGIPITSALAGAEATGVTSIMIAFLIPTFNISAVIALEIFRGKINLKRIFNGIITNPLIISSLVAIAFVVFGIRIPTVVESTIKDVGKIATPLALILLGGSFKFSKINGNELRLVIVAAFKLLIMPMVFLSLAAIMGWRGAELSCLMVLFGSPTAVSSFTMAESMGADGELAAQIVVITTLLSIFTIFLMIVILKSFSLI